MPANFDQANTPITIPDIYHYTGVRTWPAPQTLKALLGIEERNTHHVILFEWDVNLSYLGLEVSWGSSRSEQFHNDTNKAQKQLLACGVSREAMPRFLKPEEELRPSKKFLIGEVPSEATLTLTFAIDTDLKSYVQSAPLPRKQADQAASRTGRIDDQQGVEARLIVTAYLRQGERPMGEQGPVAHRTLIVRLTPAQLMEPFKGFVALDLGNTTSTLASLEGDSDHPDEIQVSGVETNAYAEPTTRTAVRLQDYKPGVAPPARRGEVAELPIPEAKFNIGDLAMRPGPGWLVLGAKRLLADPDVGGQHHAWLGDRKVEIPKRMPAELFVTGMFRAFHNEKRKYISRLAVTCPTTFSDRERAQLKRAIYNAWLRSLGQEFYKRDALQAMEKRIPLVIDEASAAAYFFLYRDFVNAPGGLRAFHYRYPQGLNVLLYDCGGGTTDISLVQAKTRPGEDEVRLLEIEVLGRTGLRGFGGDNITVAVFCLLQAKLAVALSAFAARGERLTFPTDPANLHDFLETNRAAINRMVPLQFDPKRVDREDQREPMEATMELWLWAEQFKLELSGKDPDASADGEAGHQEPVSLDYVGDSRLVALLVRKHNGLRAEDCERFLKGIKLHHTEVDALVQGDIDRSIDKANRVLAKKLPEGSEVHRVYVVGNASRYPLVRERIRERLQVRFLKEEGDRPGRLFFDESNLKNAVAKGAVLALRQDSVLGGVSIHFDNKLIDRLPYDIVYHDGGPGEFRCLYREHTPYGELETQMIPAPRFTEGSAVSNRELFLRRRWPGDGDGDGERYLSFHFTENVLGPLELSYVRAESTADTSDGTSTQPHFVLKDKGSYGQEVKGVEKTEAAHSSPPQQGLIRLPKKENRNG